MNNDVIEYFKMIVDEINENRNHMLGYPANYADKSPDVLLAEMLYNKIGFANNCGSTNATGNYKMDSKRIEKQILEKVAKFRLNIFSRGKNMKKMMYLLWWNIIKY